MSGIWEKRQTGFPSPSREGDPSEEPGHRGNEGDRAERPVSAGSLGEDKDGRRAGLQEGGTRPSGAGRLPTGAELLTPRCQDGARGAVLSNGLGKE